LTLICYYGTKPSQQIGYHTIPLPEHFILVTTQCIRLNG